MYCLGSIPHRRAHPMNYDAIIIGSGQAGNPLAYRLADLSWSVALIEKKNLGGTCINVGCTPTKTMVHRAQVAQYARNAARWGVNAAKTENDFVFLSDNFGEIDADVRGVDTPARGVSRILSNLRAVDHCFGGRAADVDACPAQILFLYKRDRPAQIGEPIRERIAGLA